MTIFQRGALFLIMILLVMPGLGRAQQATREPPLASSGMLIPWLDFKTLLDQIQVQPTPTPKPQAPVDVVFTACRIKASLNSQGDGLQLGMEFNVEVLRDDRWVEIRVAPESLLLQSAMMDGSPAKLYRKGGFEWTTVRGAGEHDFVLRTVLPVTNSQGRWTVDLRYPPAPAANLDLMIPGKNLVVRAEPGVNLGAEEKQGATRIKLGLDGSGRSRISWFRKIEENQRQTSLMAESTTALEIGEGSFRGNAAVDYRIHGKGIRHFEVEIPEMLTILDVSGQGLQNWHRSEPKEGRATLSVDLDFEATGNWRFQMQFEGMLPQDGAPLEIPDILIRDVRRERGFLAVSAASNIEIRPEGEMTNLSLVDPSEMPPALRSSAGGDVLFVFKYLSHPIRAKLEVVKHQDLEVKRTVIEEARLLSFVNTQGRRLTSATYRLRNNRKQFLALDLPQESTLWGCFREGLPIKASKREDGAILIPLEKTSLEENSSLRSFELKVVYSEESKLRGGISRQAFRAPAADVDILSMKWSMYLPTDRQYFAFSGDLRPLLQEEPVPPVSPGNPPVIEGDKLSRDQDSRLGASYQRAPKREKQALVSQVTQLQNEWNAPISNGRARGMLPVDIEIPTEGRRFRFGGKLYAPDESPRISFWVAPLRWHLPRLGAAWIFLLSFLATLGIGLSILLSKPLKWTLLSAVALLVLLLISGGRYSPFAFALISAGLTMLVLRWFRSREQPVGEGF